MLIYISSVSTVLTVVMLIATLLFQRWSKAGMSHDIRQKRLEAKAATGSIWKGYFRLNTLFLRIPVIRTLTLNLQRSLTMIGEKEYKYLVRKTSRIMLSLVIGMSIAIIVFYRITGNILYTCVLAFLIWYISDSYLDFFVSRGHTRLLSQMLGFIADVRHKYYEYHVVDDAIYEASAKLDSKSREMSVQGEGIHNVLTASDQDEALAKYLETAPNPFLKMLANFSLLTMEYGDTKSSGNSVFLSNLTFLSKNVQLELDKRLRLEYALKSMGVIVLLPLVAMSPMKEWAVHHFAPLGKFYRSPMGQYTELLTLLIVIGSMILLNKIQNLDRMNKQQWQFQWLTDKLTLDLRREMKRKWIYGGIGFLLTLVLIFSIQLQGRKSLEYKIYYEDTFLGGNYSEEEIIRRTEESKTDYGFIKDSNIGVTALDIDIYLESFESYAEGRSSRIQEKIILYHRYSMKWWHIIVAIFFGLVTYNLPEMNRWIDGKVKKLDMEDEVAGFQSIIMMLMYNKRMTVEEILEWLEMYAIQFSIPLHRCLLNLASGEVEALEQLKDEVDNSEMKRLIEQLILASEDLSLMEAFDELAQEKNNFFEGRKWENEKRINRKIMLGQTVGFVPAYGMIVFYMILPMIISSTNELGRFFEQLIQ